MRHQKKRNKLSRDAGHRKALIRNLCGQVIYHLSCIYTHIIVLL